MEKKEAATEAASVHAGVQAEAAQLCRVGDRTILQVAFPVSGLHLP